MKKYKPGEIVYVPACYFIVAKRHGSGLGLTCNLNWFATFRGAEYSRRAVTPLFLLNFSAS